VNCCIQEFENSYDYLLHRIADRYDETRSVPPEIAEQITAQYFAPGPDDSRHALVAKPVLAPDGLPTAHGCKSSDRCIIALLPELYFGSAN
jgi:hypothetical protein